MGAGAGLAVEGCRWVADRIEGSCPLYRAHTIANVDGEGVRMGVR